MPKGTLSVALLVLFVRGGKSFIDTLKDIQAGSKITFCVEMYRSKGGLGVRVGPYNASKLWCSGMN